MKVEALKKELDRLEKFIGQKEFYDKQEILDWIAECTSVFSHLDVNDHIIRDFVSIFQYPNSELDPYESIPRIGPFIGVFDKTVNKVTKYRIQRPNVVRVGNFFYANIAFTTARRIIEEKEAEERLVPKALITVLSEKDEYSHIVSSLELIEKAFEERNADGVLKNSITLLESILNLDQN